jgi:hypothetical protein
MDWIEVKKDLHQIENFILVECIAEIRNNETGEIREYETYELLKIGDDGKFSVNLKKSYWDF